MELNASVFAKRIVLAKEEAGFIMEKLVYILKSIEASGLVESDDLVLRNRDHDDISLAEAYATTLFVSEEGVPKFDEIDRLYKEHGYVILPGQRERYGSVTGVIQTKKGLIVFG